MDRARSDADRSSSERDRAHAEADQRASQRDQTDSDREWSTQAATDARFQEALAAIRSERARSAAGREAAAEERTRAAEDREFAAVDRNRAALDRERSRAELEQARIELEQAQLDDLTGFYRLGLGTTVLQREIDRSRRSGAGLAFAFCDVDGLKQVNDERGHAAGDAALRGLAKALRSRLRPYDPVVRVGGDEFVCALSEVNLEQAGKVFHDVQEVFSSDSEGASVSVGLAALRPDDDLSTLLERSDHALREARSTAKAR